MEQQRIDINATVHSLMHCLIRGSSKRGKSSGGTLPEQETPVGHAKGDRKHQVILRLMGAIFLILPPSIDTGVNKPLTSIII
jgi:hypothetical protein